MDCTPAEWRASNQEKLLAPMKWRERPDVSGLPIAILRMVFCWPLAEASELTLVTAREQLLKARDVPPLARHGLSLRGFA